MRRITPLSPTIRVIPVASSLGAPIRGAELGPQNLIAAGLPARLRHQGLSCSVLPALSPTPPAADALHRLLLALGEQTEACLRAGERPLILGGDHSLAAGSWKGIARALGAMPHLIWIDAHLDAHTPETSPSAMAHGMPVAALLGLGAPELVDIPGPRLQPGQVTLIGARSYEAEELQRLQQLGVRIHLQTEVAARGLGEILDEVFSAFGDQAWGISLDVDALDPRQAPGVSTPVTNGLDADEVLHALRGRLRERQCVGIEIAEFNPLNDSDGRTARLLLQLADQLAAPDGATLARWEKGFGANNYAPLPVVLTAGQGCWLQDVDGRRYLDFMAAYSANSFGHAHPRLLAALTEQAGRLSLTSRAYHNDRLPLFLRRLTMLSGYERVLPLNTGLEAVETALKAARKWGHKIKGIPDGKAEIIACVGNFHGRSIAITGLSSEAQYRDGFGPFPPGLITVPYGDPAALAAAITPNTAAFLVEPIQGEGGVIVPPDGYLAACAAICRQQNVLLLVDEVQTGLGRTGKLFAYQHEPVRPDGVILGKALGGGLLPVSAFLANDSLMRVFTPGDHGSTFGGNPLAATVALAALDVLEEEQLVEHSARLGRHLMLRLQAMQATLPAIAAVRGRGLFAGIELRKSAVDARKVAEMLLKRGVLSKDTHSTVLRLAPPLIIDEATLDWGLAQVEACLHDCHRKHRNAA